MSASNATSGRRKRSAGEPPGSGGSSSSSAKRFTLASPSLELDPRIHAYRPDIADIALAGQLFAPHYARPAIRVCGPRRCPVRTAPCEDAEAVSDLFPGDEFAVLDIAGGWAWGYRRADHHVGYVTLAGLAG